MADGKWTLWKMTATAMALVMVTALVTGLVVANWSDSSLEKLEMTRETPAAMSPRRIERVASTVGPRSIAAVSAGSLERTLAAPTKMIIDTCNQRAAASVGVQNATTDVVKAAALGGVAGAGGTLYGLDQTRKRDEAYRTAYANCMRARGYAS